MFSPNDVQSIRLKIEQFRKEMVRLANEKGYAHPETVAVSTQLDDLMNLYEKRRKK